jgi:hypothetical protein
MGRFRIVRTDMPLGSDLPAAVVLGFATIAMIGLTSEMHLRERTQPGQAVPTIRIALAEPEPPAAPAPAPDGRAQSLAAAQSPHVAGDQLAAAPSQTAPETAGSAPYAPGVAPAEPIHSLAARPRPAAVARGGFIPLDFDLASHDAVSAAERPAPGGAVDVRKSVREGDRTLGNVTVRIDRQSRLFVDSAQLRAMLSGQQRWRAIADRVPQTGLVSFTSLRADGLDLRYDPVTDQLSLRPA